MEQVLQLLGLSAEASLEDVLAAVTEENRASVAEALGLPAEATLEEVKAALEELFAGAGGGGGDGGGGDGGGGDGGGTHAVKRVVATIAKALELGAVGDVDKLVAAANKKLADTAGGTSALRQQVTELQTQVSGLREINARTQFDALIASKEHAGKIPPNEKERDKFFKLFRDDREMFDTVLAQLAPKVTDRSVFQRGGPRGPTDRVALIAAAKKTYAEEVADPDKTTICSEKAWVHTALRDAKQPTLTDEEIAQHAIRTTV